jgi:DNA invertase Pin-like site-specific DNA recombinase
MIVPPRTMSHPKKGSDRRWRAQSRRPWRAHARVLPSRRTAAAAPAAQRSASAAWSAAPIAARRRYTRPPQPQPSVSTTPLIETDHGRDIGAGRGVPKTRPEYSRGATRPVTDLSGVSGTIRRMTIKTTTIETGRVIGYCRVSTTDGRQKTDLQRDALAKAGVNILYEDHCSGVKTSRPDLDRCLAELREGDTLVIWRLDRLGRSMEHLIEVVGEFERRGVHLRSLHETIDTTTATGRMIFRVMATLAAFERELTAERVAAGVASYRARTGRWGRDPKVSADQLDAAQALIRGGRSVTSTAAALGVGRSTLYRALKDAAA